MKNQSLLSLLVILSVFFFSSCGPAARENQSNGQFHADVPFHQDYSVKYELEDASILLSQVASDRNGYIQLLGSKGLMRLRAGKHLFPGTVVPDFQD